MSSKSSTQTRIPPPAAAGESAPAGSIHRGPIFMSGGAASTTPALDDQPTVISKDLPLGAPLAITNLAPAEMGRLLLGQRLGHYDLLEFVGGGGMGAVFKAHDTMLDRVVAVKVLSKVQSDDEETLRRFKNEAQSAARLDHDNIGRVHYVGEDRGWHYIVFEYIEGVNLRDLVLRDGPLPLAQAVSYTLQVADALAHASRRDVVHRDIKPSNVLITPEGRAKLVDMGLARLHQVAQPDQDLTASGVTLGTFDYISPEQARDPRDADVRSDLYSLGCTLYYALTGRPPFPDGTVLQKLLQHQADDPVDARQLRPDLPEEMSRVLKKLLAKTPQQRYQRPDDLVTDLLAIAARYGLEVPPPSAAQRLASVPVESPRWVKHLPWLVPLAILAAVVVALALTPSGRDEGVKPPPIHQAALRSADAVTPATLVNSPDALNAAATGSDRAAVHTAISAAAAAESSPNAAQPKSAQPSSVQSSSVQPSSVPPTTANSANPTGTTAVAGSKANNAATQPTPIGTNTPANAIATLPATASPVNTTASGGSLPDGAAPLLKPQAPSLPASDPAASATSAPKLPNSVAPVGPNSSSTLPNAPAPASSPTSAAAGKSAADAAVAIGSPVVGNSGAAAAAPTSVALAASAAPEKASPGVSANATLIVDPTAAAIRSSTAYATLADACRAAHSGDVIEVHANGVLRERPIDLVAVRLTIRAGDGFLPIVSFQSQKADPLRESRSMLTLGGSELTLSGLQLEFDVPRSSMADSWSLAEIRPGESLRLDRCVVTVRNNADSAANSTDSSSSGAVSAGAAPGEAARPDAVMFDVCAVPDPGMMATDDAPVVRPPALLQFSNSILRGEATIVRSNELQPLRLTWDNGLLGTSERFFSMAGATSDVKPVGETDLAFRHVTLLARAGLCRVTNTQNEPQTLPLNIAASDCIFLCGPSAALVEQSGVDSLQDFRRRLTWNGERNFYEGFSTFWRIGSSAEPAPLETTAHDWQAYWAAHEAQPSLGKVAWQQSPPERRAASLLVPADFALRPGDNPALRSAADGRDAGMQASLLPPIGESDSMPVSAPVSIPQQATPPPPIPPAAIPPAAPSPSTGEGRGEGAASR